MAFALLWWMLGGFNERKTGLCLVYGLASVLGAYLLLMGACAYVEYRADVKTDELVAAYARVCDEAIQQELSPVEVVFLVRESVAAEPFFTAKPDTINSDQINAAKPPAEVNSAASIELFERLPYPGLYPLYLEVTIHFEDRKAVRYVVRAKDEYVASGGR